MSASVGNAKVIAISVVVIERIILWVLNKRRVIPLWLEDRREAEILQFISEFLLIFLCRVGSVQKKVDF